MLRRLCLVTQFSSVQFISVAQSCLTLCNPMNRSTQSCPTLCNPMDCILPDSSVQGDSTDKNSGVGCHGLLQGIFPTQGSNPSLLHCRRILYHLSHQGSLKSLDSNLFKSCGTSLAVHWSRLGRACELDPWSES